MPPRLKPDEPTKKLEIMIPADLKAAAERAAREAGHDNLSAWLRWLIRRETAKPKR